MYVLRNEGFYLLANRAALFNMQLLIRLPDTGVSGKIVADFDNQRSAELNLKNVQSVSPFRYPATGNTIIFLEEARRQLLRVQNDLCVRHRKKVCFAIDRTYI